MSEISAEQAIAALEQHKRDREEVCARALKALLDEHKCTIDVAMTLKPGCAPAVTYGVVAL